MSFLPYNDKSFFMGWGREDGLRLRMQYRNHTVFTDMTITKAHQGFDSVVHGGMLFGILDTMIWNVIFMETGKICMTRKTDMDFLKPVMCETSYRAQAKFLRVDDRDVWATAWIEDGNKERYAQLNGLFREVKHIDLTPYYGHLIFDGVSPAVKEHYLRMKKPRQV